jgi:hypothetical protein
MQTESLIYKTVETGKKPKILLIFDAELTADFWFSFTPKYLIPTGLKNNRIERF